MSCQLGDVINISACVASHNSLLILVLISYPVSLICEDIYHYLTAGHDISFISNTYVEKYH